MRVQDFVNNSAAVPESLFFKDGLEEILDSSSELEGIDLGFLGNVLDPIGLFKTGGPPPPGSPPGTQGTPGGLFGGISQGIGQALGMGGAGSPLGSLFGAGAGGVGPGTGILPGGLGQMATSLFGQPAIPPAGQALQQAAPVDYATIANHTEKAGRAVVRRILGGVNPPLNQLRSMLNQRRNQIQATAEHRQLNAADAAHREVLGFIAGAMGTRPGTRIWSA